MERLFGAIPGVLRELGAPDSAIEALVLVAWKEAAGELLSQRTAALEFAKDRLVVAVEDATWQRHLQELAPQLLASLNAVAGQGLVKFIEYRIAPGSISVK